jgi:hypothetical protein
MHEPTHPGSSTGLDQMPSTVHMHQAVYGIGVSGGTEHCGEVIDDVDTNDRSPDRRRIAHISLRQGHTGCFQGGRAGPVPNQRPDRVAHCRKLQSQRHPGKARGAGYQHLW